MDRLPNRTVMTNQAMLADENVASLNLAYRINVAPPNKTPPVTFVFSKQASS
jgi:hypothetical protein